MSRLRHMVVADALGWRSHIVRSLPARAAPPDSQIFSASGDVRGVPSTFDLIEI